MDSDDPIRRQVIPRPERQAFTAMMEDSLAEDRHSPGAGPRPSLPRPGADAGDHAVRQLLPLLHALAASSATPAQNFSRSDYDAQIDYLRRTPQVRDVLLSAVAIR